MQKPEPPPKRSPGSGAHLAQISPAIIDLRWQNMLRREFHIKQMWHWKWDELLLQPEYRPPFHHICTWKDKYDFSKQCLDKLKPKQSPPIPLRTSDLIGWRSNDAEKSFNLYKIAAPALVPKIRFERETYGYYRVHPSKLMMVTEDETSSTSLQSRTRRQLHKVKPLLC